MKVKVKTLAQLHIVSILIAAWFSGYDISIAVDYVVWSFMLWIFGYPIYYVLGEPGWDDY